MPLPINADHYGTLVGNLMAMDYQSEPCNLVEDVEAALEVAAIVDAINF